MTRLAQLPTAAAGHILACIVCLPFYLAIVAAYFFVTLLLVAVYAFNNTCASGTHVLMTGAL